MNYKFVVLMNNGFPELYATDGECAGENVLILGEHNGKISHPQTDYVTQIADYEIERLLIEAETNQ